MAPASTYPNTSDYNHMVMTGGEYMSPERLFLYKIPNLPKLPDESTLEVDSSTSKEKSQEGHDALCFFL